MEEEDVKKNEKIRQWIWRIMFWGVLIFLAGAFVINLLIMRRMHINMRVGQRSEEECGYKYMEYESGRFNAYQTYKSNATKLKMSTNSIQISMLVLMITLSLYIYFFIYKDEDDEYTFLSKPIRWSMLGVAAVYGLLFIGTFMISSRKPKSYDDMEKEKKKQKLAYIISYGPTLFLVGFIIYLYSKGYDADNEISYFFKPWIILYVIAFIYGYYSKLDYTNVVEQNDKIYADKYAEFQAKFIDLVEFLKNKQDQKLLNVLDDILKRNYKLAVVNSKDVPTTLLEPETTIIVDKVQVKVSPAIFIEHTGGMELDELLNYGVSSSSTSTKETVTASSVALKEKIDAIRVTMKDLRDINNNYIRVITKAIMHTIILLLLIVSARLFLIYHLTYIYDPSKTVIIWAMYNIVGVSATVLYGWFMSAIVL